MMATVSNRDARRFTERLERRAEAIQSCADTIALLAERDGNLPDGASNPIPEGLPAGVSVRDASSFANPNWFPSSVFDKSGFSSWFLPDMDGAAFSDLRGNAGPVTDLPGAYRSVWPPDVMSRFMTAWSPWPVNCSDPTALAGAYAARTGDGDAAERFALAVREARLAGRRIGFTEFQTLAGTHWDAIAGLFVTDAPINANVAPREVLLNLLLWDGLSAARAHAALESLVSLRGNRSISASELPTLLGVGSADQLFDYLGDRTLVWEIRVDAGIETLVTRCLRLYQTGPAGEDMFMSVQGNPALRVIDRVWVSKDGVDD